MKMRKLIMAMLAMVIATFTVEAQHDHHHDSGKKEATLIKTFDNVNADVKTLLGNLLADYFKLKDALVADKEDEASQSAKTFRKTLQRVDMTKMTAEQHSFFMDLMSKLDYDAEHIGGAPNIEHMREHFASVSNNMYAIVKAFQANNGTPVYYDYCPMQKTNWLSSEEAIKNPYYGKQMLTCGKVTETIN